MRVWSPPSMSGEKASINNHTLVLSLPDYTAYGSLLERMTVKCLKTFPVH